MARPKREQALNATEYVGVRIHEDLRAALERIADAKGVRLTEEIRTALQEHVKRDTRKARS
jgi:DNA polymerase III delta prime subunit